MLPVQWMTSFHCTHIPVGRGGECGLATVPACRPGTCRPCSGWPDAVRVAAEASRHGGDRTPCPDPTRRGHTRRASARDPAASPRVDAPVDVTSCCSNDRING